MYVCMYVCMYVIYICIITHMRARMSMPLGVNETANPYYLYDLKTLLLVNMYVCVYICIYIELK